MVDWSSPEIIGSVGASALATLSGISGAMLNEYKYQSRPMFAHNGVSHDRKTENEKVTLPNHIYQGLQNIKIITNKSPEITINDADNIHNVIHDLAKQGGELVEKINSLILYLDDNASDGAMSIIKDVFSYKIFRHAIKFYFTFDKISFPELEDYDYSDWTEKVPVNIQTDDNGIPNGKIMISFPGNTVVEDFSGFILTVYKCKPFFDAIRFMHQDNLSKYMRIIVKLLENDLVIANQIDLELEGFIQRESKFGFRLYCANMGKHPILISPKSLVQIVDDKAKLFIEDCYLVEIIPDTDGNGELHFRRSSPLIVKAGEDLEIIWVTCNKQKEMDYGEAFRERYEKGNSYYQIDMEITRIGKPKPKRISTNQGKFSS